MSLFWGCSRIWWCIITSCAGGVLGGGTGHMRFSPGWVKQFQFWCSVVTGTVRCIGPMSAMVQQEAGRLAEPKKATLFLQCLPREQRLTRAEENYCGKQLREGAGQRSRVLSGQDARAQ